jgi:hypothetical protein
LLVAISALRVDQQRVVASASIARIRNSVGATAGTFPAPSAGGRGGEVFARGLFGYEDDVGRRAPEYLSPNL